MNEEPKQLRNGIGIGTYLQLGVVVSIVAGAWVVRGAISELSSKVMALDRSVNALVSSDKAHSNNLSGLQTKIAVIEAAGSPQLRELVAKMIEFEKVGSPALVPRIVALEKELLELKLKGTR
jgi:hypothetical protein